jgi:hypothetical protein
MLVTSLQGFIDQLGKIHLAEIPAGGLACFKIAILARQLKNHYEFLLRSTSHLREVLDIYHFVVTIYKLLLSKPIDPVIIHEELPRFTVLNARIAYCDKQVKKKIIKK